MALLLIQKFTLKLMKFAFSTEIGRGGVSCYIRSDISFKLNSFLPNEIESITFDATHEIDHN